MVHFGGGKLFRRDFPNTATSTLFSLMRSQAPSNQRDDHILRSCLSPPPLKRWTQSWQLRILWTTRKTSTPQVANTRPVGGIRPSTLFYLARHLVSTWQQSSSLPLVKEYLHLHSPKITFYLLKATARLMWPPWKMSLTPLLYSIGSNITENYYFT